MSTVAADKLYLNCGFPAIAEYQPVHLASQKFVQKFKRERLFCATLMKIFLDQVQSRDHSQRHQRICRVSRQRDDWVLGSCQTCKGVNASKEGALSLPKGDRDSFVAQDQRLKRRRSSCWGLEIPPCHYCGCRQLAIVSGRNVRRPNLIVLLVNLREVVSGGHWHIST